MTTCDDFHITQIDSNLKCNFHLNCIGVELEILERGISEPENIKIKLSAWLDNTMCKGGNILSNLGEAKL